MRLIIFDLDQTIIRSFSLHNQATMRAFRKVFGVRARLDEIDFAGNTIEHNLRALAKLKRISNKDLERNLRKLTNVYINSFISVMKGGIKRYLLPGAYSLVKRLKNNRENRLVMVTGDSRIITNKVLKTAGLVRDFSFIVSGERGKDKKALAKPAMKIARARCKIDKIVWIGDSVHDVEAGKSVKALTISPLTGTSSENKLRKAGANYVFKNLNNSRIAKTIESY